MKQQIRIRAYGVVAGLFFVAWLVCATPVWADAPTFEAHYPLGAGGAATQSLVGGDLDGDGDLDLVVGNENQPNVIYWNDGAGRFDTSYVFTATYWTEALAWGDFNNDNSLDLVVSDFVTESVVYLNDGQGHFNSVRGLGSASNGIRALAIGDVNNDGDLDIVATHYSGQECAVYDNDGAGNFTRAVIGAIDAPGLALGDLNGDHLLDIVLVNASGLDRIYFSNGAGGFVAQSFGGAGEARSLTLGDINLDGQVDIVVGYYAWSGPARPMVVYLNQGGVFHTGSVDCAAPPAGVQCFGPDYTVTTSLTAADMDNDGDLDLVAGSEGEANVIYYNHLDGDWTQTATFGARNDQTSSVAVGDWNSDGYLDIASGNTAQQNMIYLNDGAGVLSGARGFGPVYNRSNQVVVGDMNADGALDLVTGANWNFSVPYYVHLNDGAGQFTSAAFGASTDWAWALALGDLNKDGTLDVVAGNFGVANKLYLNQGDATFAAQTLDTDSFNTMGIAVGDLDGNGYLDIVVANHLQPNYFYLNQGDLNQDGSWDGSFSRHTLGTTSGLYRDVALDDLDGDSDLEIVLGAWGKDKIYWNDGAAQFTETAFGAQSDTTWGVATGDLDGDADMDIAVVNALQQNRVYWNEGGAFTQTQLFGTGADATKSLAMGDVDDDGDLDLVLGNEHEVGEVCLNDGAGGFAVCRTFGAEDETITGVALGDLDGDGSLDIVTAVTSYQNRVYFNQRNRAYLPANQPPVVSIGRPGTTANGESLSTAEILAARFVAIPYTLSDPEGDPVRFIRAFYSLDGGDDWQPALAADGTLTTNLTTGAAVYTNAVALSDPIPDGGMATFVLPLVAPGVIQDVDVWTSIQHATPAEIKINLTAPSSQTVTLINHRGGYGVDFGAPTFDDQAVTAIAAAAAPFSGAYRPEQALALLRGGTATGNWVLTVWDENAPTEFGSMLGWGIAVTTVDTTTGALHTYVWDVAGSGVFGRSDHVVFRLEAYPGFTPTPGAIAGPYRRSYAAATTFPFRVRGTQVRVCSDTLSDTLPVAGAQVYRLPKEQSQGGAPLINADGRPFTTDALGYLQGRGQLASDDRLLALLPITATATYTLYYTSGAPTLVGVDAYTVTASGAQTLTVSADHPLILFNLDVSLEWDAHNDVAYLEQLQTNLHRASEYLYDFTNGQVALGHVNVFQNADEWAASHVVIHANNRLRPFAAQGGVVLTDTLDPEHADIRYSPGQVSLGSTWNRYGNPGQSLGDDWAIILAHELSHYLLFHDDTYLGLDDAGFLIPITTCLGSAMGDLYNDPAATEFIADESYWQAACAQTLPERTLGRNEWETMRLWYPALVSPTAILAGPALAPFDFTGVMLHAPYTPTTALLDPTFYADYAGGGSASSEARAYLFSQTSGGDYVVNLGSPYGGQNRVLARGAQPDDRLCVFDRPRAQFGCETIALGDDRLALRRDAAWNPVIQITPINTATLNLSVTVGAPITWPVVARLFPELGYGAAPVTLTGGALTGVYTAVFRLDAPALAGHLQVWVNEPATETTPRRESLVAFNVGGNPGVLRGGGGVLRGGGGVLRGGGGVLRGGGGVLRGGGGVLRGGGAPLMSPDGQLIFFTENPGDFITGTLFAVQAMAGVPPLPPGRTLVGQGYSLIASPGAALPSGSISLQYLSNDVLVAGAQENQLTLYFWNGAAWNALESTQEAYFNLVTAPSQGPGLYALLASIQIPLTGPGWNNIAYPVAETRSVTDALLAISGAYTTVYGYVPTDKADPWKVFDVTVADWVNDLHTLEFGKGYWIHASQNITLHLAGGVQTRMCGPQAAPYLPATYYGEILATPAFTPAVGMSVTAWVGGALCGQTAARLVDGRIVYVVDVEADSPGSSGCGAPGRAVTFRVDGRSMSPAIAWSVSQLWELALRSTMPPDARSDANSTQEDTAILLTVLENDHDPEGGPLTVTAITLPRNGVAVLSGTTALMYTPTLNFNGVDVITYTIVDSEALTDTATVSITVTPVNDPPTISDIGNQTTQMGLSVGPLLFTVGDVDTADAALDVSAATTNPALAPLNQIALGGSGMTRTLILTPTAELTGTAYITVSVSDGEATSSDAFLLMVTTGEVRHSIYVPLVMRKW